MIRYEEKDFRLAEEFCAIALGADRFYRDLQSGEGGEESFTVEGLAPVDFSGVAPREIHSWEEAIDGLTQIYRGYESLSDPARRNYMLQQVGSFRKVCRWLSGAPMDFREIAAETMFIDENPVGAGFLEGKYRAMDAALGEAGYTGTLEQRLASWREAREIHGGEATEKTLNDLLAQAKERALAKGFTAIKDFDVRAEVVYNKPYSGYCDYFTRMIYINGAITYTYDELKHLVCHEAYPGHMTHMAIRQQLLEAGRIPADAGLVLTNTASSPIFEGLADNGMAALDWEDDVNDRICRYLTEIQSICNVNASHILYCGGGKEAAADYLRKYSFGSESRIDSRLRYMGFPFRKAYMYAYWRGWDAVARKWESLRREERPAFLQYLYENMHSVDTVAQFGEN